MPYHASSTLWNPAQRTNYSGVLYCSKFLSIIHLSTQNNAVLSFLRYAFRIFNKLQQLLTHTEYPVKLCAAIEIHIADHLIEISPYIYSKWTGEMMKNQYIGESFSLPAGIAWHAGVAWRACGSEMWISSCVHNMERHGLFVFTVISIMTTSNPL